MVHSRRIGTPCMGLPRHDRGVGRHLQSADARLKRVQSKVLKLGHKVLYARRLEISKPDGYNIPSTLARYLGWLKIHRLGTRWNQVFRVPTFCIDVCEEMNCLRELANATVRNPALGPAIGWHDCSKRSFFVHTAARIALIKVPIFAYASLPVVYIIQIRALFETSVAQTVMVWIVFLGDSGGTGDGRGPCPVSEHKLLVTRNSPLMRVNFRGDQCNLAVGPRAHI